jgi:hypothetical protein
MSNYDHRDLEDPSRFCSLVPCGSQDATTREVRAATIGMHDCGSDAVLVLWI